MRFFENVLKAKFMKKYDKIKPYQYSGMPKKTREKFVKSLEQSNSDYIIFSDFDMASCITKSKVNLQTKISTADLAKIAIVKTEIESWYLAGLDNQSTRKLGIPFYPNTENITKEQFEKVQPKKFTSKIDFMQDILKLFNFDVAKRQNDSFRYVWQKFIF